MKIYLASTAPGTENDNSIHMRIYLASFKAKETKPNEQYEIANRLLSYHEIITNSFGAGNLFQILTKESNNENQQSRIAESP
jgi:hypothetical protein